MNVACYQVVIQQFGVSLFTVGMIVVEVCLGMVSPEEIRPKCVQFPPAPVPRPKTEAETNPLPPPSLATLMCLIIESELLSKIIYLRDPCKLGAPVCYVDLSSTSHVFI